MVGKKEMEFFLKRNMMKNLIINTTEKILVIFSFVKYECVERTVIR